MDAVTAPVDVAIVPTPAGSHGSAQPIACPVAAVNPIRTRSDWDSARAACRADPGRFHGAIARRELHWFDPSLGEPDADGVPGGAWITQAADGRWAGIDARSARPVVVPHGPDHEPWSRAFDDDEPPFYRWFVGARTNACLNEVDRHVALGHGDEVALLIEGDRWDQSLDAGRGGPVRSEAITRKRLLLEVAKAAGALEALGLRAGDRLAINMPNAAEQVYYTEAAKRLGVLYTPSSAASRTRRSPTGSTMPAPAWSSRPTERRATRRWSRSRSSTPTPHSTGTSRSRARAASWRTRSRRAPTC
jgi:acrylyl-CoA reductase (NADPH)/3-hydroxypropionyl-CoA dehydratase/3-hydroxypropionyl-CoA synthetase